MGIEGGSSNNEIQNQEINQSNNEQLEQNRAEHQRSGEELEGNSTIDNEGERKQIEGKDDAQDLNEDESSKLDDESTIENDSSKEQQEANELNNPEQQQLDNQDTIDGDFDEAPDENHDVTDSLDEADSINDISENDENESESNDAIDDSLDAEDSIESESANDDVDAIDDSEDDSLDDADSIEAESEETEDDGDEPAESEETEDEADKPDESENTEDEGEQPDESEDTEEDGDEPDESEDTEEDGDEPDESEDTEDEGDEPDESEDTEEDGDEPDESEDTEEDGDEPGESEGIEEDGDQPDESEDTEEEDDEPDESEDTEEDGGEPDEFEDAEDDGDESAEFKDTEDEADKTDAPEDKANKPYNSDDVIKNPENLEKYNNVEEFNNDLKKIYADKGKSNQEKVDAARKCVDKLNNSDLDAGKKKKSTDAVSDARALKNPENSDWNEKTKDNPFPPLNIDFPEKMGLDFSKKISSIGRGEYDSQLPETGNRYGGEGGYNFTCKGEDGQIPSLEERSLPKVYVPEKDREVHFDHERYCDAIDAIRDSENNPEGSLETLNSIIDDINAERGTNIKHLDDDELEALFDEYTELQEGEFADVRKELKIDDKNFTAYGVHGYAKSMEDINGDTICQGGANQFNTTLHEYSLKRLGVEY